MACVVLRHAMCCGAKYSSVPRARASGEKSKKRRTTRRRWRNLHRRKSMSESEIRAYAQGRGFHDQTLARWLGWERTDRDALGELASGLKIGENHLRDMMDWL